MAILAKCHWQLPSVSLHEIARHKERSDARREMMVGLELKSIALMKDFVHKFLKPKQVVLKFLAGLLSSGKGFLLVETQCHFFGLEKYA